MHQTAQVFEARPTLRIIVGTLGGEERYGVIVRRQLDPQIVGISDVKQPLLLLLNSYAAVTERVAE